MPRHKPKHRDAPSNGSQRQLRVGELVRHAIAEMLTRIRNAVASKHRRVDMPTSKMKVEIARLLKQTNFITDYKTLETEDGRTVLRVALKYAGGTPVIRELQRVSTPGLRQYVGAGEIPRVRNGLGVALLSTSQGLMTDREARAKRTGGELLAYIW